MFSLILKYYLIEESLSVLFNNISKNIGTKNELKFGDIIKVTFKDNDGTEAVFNKARVLEISNYHLMLDTPTTHWKLNLLDSEQNNISLTWKTMKSDNCHLLYTDEEIEHWELTHSSPWFLEYKSISNLIVEKL